MKKILTILLAALLAATLATGLVACGESGNTNGEDGNTNGESVHTHNYGTAWASDETNHWHACTATGNCDAPKKDEGAHTWNEGEITTQATEDADGVKTYTCTACGKTKTESVKYVPSAYVPEEGKAYVFDHFEKYDFWRDGELLDWKNDTSAVAANTGATMTFTNGVIVNYNPNVPVGDKSYTIDYTVQEDGKYVATDMHGDGAYPMELIKECYFIVEEEKVTFYEEVDNASMKFTVIAIYTAQA